MRSKENKIIELFFESPTREWHFEEIVRESKIARSKADNWLKKFVNRGLVQKVKNRAKMPYYVSNHASKEYRHKKKIFALNKLYDSGLLTHLSSLQKAKTVILFGSFSRSDWHKNSDVDIFIYGDPEGLKIVDYELKLHRDIQLFIFRNKEELKKVGSGLIRNIIKGNLLNGNLDFIGVNISA